jgi:hypothetical protein
MIAGRAGGGNRETVLSQLVGNADLSEGRSLDRQRAMASSIACSTFFNPGFLRLISFRAIRRLGPRTP